MECIKVDMVWKKIPGYELYEASQCGKIRSIRSNRLLSPWLHKGKWLRVTISIKGKRTNLRVHRAVGMAFIDNPNNKPEINHIDGNPQNNHFSNLEWCTTEENIKHYNKCIKVK